ncbi:MAG TPA: ATP-binding protein [Chryseolinea sp.]
MKNVIRQILYAGIKPGLSLQLSRTIILTNAIAMTTTLLCGLLLAYILYRNDWNWSYLTKMIVVTIFVLLVIHIFNKLERLNLSRTLLSVIVPIMSTLMVIIPRINDPALYHYLPRNPGLFCTLLVTSVVPLMLFSTKELRYLLPTLGLNLSIIVLIDPATFWFSADADTSTYGAARYLGNNVIIFVSESFLIGSTVFLKTLFEYFEKENETLIRNLNEKNEELKQRNRELYQLNQDVETQNEEIQAQSEELMQSQESLLTAHHEIDRQKSELEKQNLKLEQSLDVKSKDLLNTNQQLVVQNHELQQFSYTVSHNLRGPVASMLGLMNIYHLSENADEKSSVFKLMEKSAHSLETVIHDLNKIIDIRKDKFQATEKVSLEAEVNLITHSLNVFITEKDVTIRRNFEANEIISIKAYVNSILYNLISNAIQYRSAERSLVIDLTSYRKDDFVVIEVTDNGLGIDLDRYRGDLFKLYKRFHTHIEGKGLGLYLVKQQVEKMNGRIEVNSVPGEWTRFSVFMKESIEGI